MNSTNTTTISTNSNTHTLIVLERWNTSGPYIAQARRVTYTTRNGRPQSRYVTHTFWGGDRILSPQMYAETKAEALIKLDALVGKKRARLLRDLDALDAKAALARKQIQELNISNPLAIDEAGRD